MFNQRYTIYMDRTSRYKHILTCEFVLMNRLLVYILIYFVKFGKHVSLEIRYCSAVEPASGSEFRDLPIRVIDDSG